MVRSMKHLWLIDVNGCDALLVEQQRLAAQAHR
jgi:hypothetical protein